MSYENYWNWQKEDWPDFTYTPKEILPFNDEFLRSSGICYGVSKHLTESERQQITIELLSNEAIKTSEIEGEILDRDSVQSSIKRCFGFAPLKTRESLAEKGIAEMMLDLYESYDEPLTHKMMWKWNELLMLGRRDLYVVGGYRVHEEAMQVVSGSLYKPKVHFEAPPSRQVKMEMDSFIDWFNSSSPNGKTPLPPLVRAGIAHLYFVCIHPFEDGNGRIGRAIVEKSLAQNLKRPTLIALSETLNNDKKSYYDELECQNKHNEVTKWLKYFSGEILKAQSYTIQQIDFIIQKAKFFEAHKNDLNARQLKAIERIMREGIRGFEGGLSAHNYMSITGASPSTATRDLANLVEKRILIQKGQRKSTRYHLSFTSHESTF